MNSHLKLVVAAGLMAAFSPMVGMGQSVAPRALPEGANELIAEMTQIQSQLAPMQEKAMQAPELQAAGETLGASIMQAMEEIEPQTPTLIARLNALGEQFQVASAAGDSEQARTLATEAGEIQQRLEVAQEAAIGRADIHAKVAEYEVKVHSRMRDENPDAGELIERLGTLNEQLTLLLQQAP